MAAPALHVMGQKVRLLERIGVAAKVFGLSRTTAYRLAERDEWPLVGPSSSRFVLMIPLLDRYGVPYEIVQEASSTAECCGTGESGGTACRG